MSQQTSWHAEAIALAHSDPPKSCAEIAKVFGVTRQRVSQVVRSAGVEKKPKERVKLPEVIDAECWVCGSPFRRKRLSVKKTCSGECNRIAARCRGHLRPLTDMYERIPALLDSGMTQWEVSRYLGVTCCYVSRVMRELGRAGERWPSVRKTAKRDVSRAWDLWWAGVDIRRIAKICKIKLPTLRIELRREALSGHLQLPPLAKKVILLLQQQRLR